VPLTDLATALLDHLPNVEVVLDVFEGTILGQPIQEFSGDLPPEPRRWTRFGARRVRRDCGSLLAG